MKSFGIGEIFPNNRSIHNEAELDEVESEIELERLLANPSNAFLSQVPMNAEVIENALSFREALTFAKKRIRERREQTLNVRKVEGAHSEHIHVNPDSVFNTLEHIQKNAREIGIGADGRVVIDTTDDVNINPEICYKFSLLEKVKRGRNTVAEEAELQGAFYEVAQTITSKDIGVPMPYYEIEVLTTQMIAMERLHAKSADDIIRGLGTLPAGFDIDRFCNSLRLFIDVAHAHNLYHRDLHFGNIMITQYPEWIEGEPMGYVIDFGLSGYAHKNMEPYKKEVAGDTFTYDDDYGRIETLRKTLKIVKARRF